MTAVLRARLSGRAAGREGLLLIVLAAVLWGTVGVTTRAIFTLAETTALSVAFLRLALSLPALGIATGAVLRKHGFSATPRHLLLMALMGVMLATYQLCYFGAIRRVGVSVATLVTLCSAPVLVGLLSTVLLGERPTRRLLLSACLAIVGTVLLVNPASGTDFGGEAGIGLLLALGSGLGYALVTIVSRTLARQYHPLTPVTVAFAFGALALLPVLLLDGPRLDFPPLGWLLLLYLGVVPTALAFVLFTIGMRTTIATVASLVTLIGPLALVGAALLLGAALMLTRE